MMVRKPSALILSLAFGFMVYVDIGFKTWMPTYLFETYGMSIGEAAFNAVIWHYAGAFLGVMIGSRVIDRLVMRKIHTARFDADIAGYFFAAPFIYLMANASGLPICILALFLSACSMAFATRAFLRRSSTSSFRSTGRRRWESCSAWAL